MVVHQTPDLDLHNDEQVIKHLDGWLSLHELTSLFKMTKQGVHRLVFNSGHFDPDDEVRAVPYSAAHVCYLIRVTAVRRELQRRIDRGLLEDPNAKPAKKTARAPRRVTSE
jgi:hypothetical protein